MLTRTLSWYDSLGESLQLEDGDVCYKTSQRLRDKVGMMDDIIKLTIKPHTCMCGKLCVSVKTKELLNKQVKSLNAKIHNFVHQTNRVVEEIDQA